MSNSKTQLGAIWPLTGHDIYKTPEMATPSFLAVGSLPPTMVEPTTRRVAVGTGLQEKSSCGQTATEGVRKHNAGGGPK